ncbi:hypothetical protein GCM10010195_12500 [Kitasatospora griseola]|nr:hypothetical protein GCM10010195_12500 [Kitasatospora griseola]
MRGWADIGSPAVSARMPFRRRAGHGPGGAQRSTGSPIREWREAVPVVMTVNLTDGWSPGPVANQCSAAGG